MPHRESLFLAPWRCAVRFHRWWGSCVDAAIDSLIRQEQRLKRTWLGLQIALAVVFNAVALPSAPWFVQLTMAFFYSSMVLMTLYAKRRRKVNS